MSEAPKKSKKGKGKNTLGAEVAIEIDGAEDEYNAPSGSNALIVDSRPKTKVKKAEDDKITKKNLKRKYLKEFYEKKVTKRMKRELAAVKERKKKKSTQEQLFKQLSSVQLDVEATKFLTSSSSFNVKTANKGELIIDAPKGSDMNVVKQKITVLPTIHQQKKVQENYYSTDSESDEEEVETVNSQTEHFEVIKEEPFVGEENETETVTQSELQNSEAVQQDSLIEPPSTIEEPSDVKVESSEELPEESESAKSDTESEVKVVETPIGKVGFVRFPVVVSTRDPALEKKRAELPIYKEEQMIVEAINESVVTVVCGETGSGKTTQIPQFLYEAGYTGNGKLIGITEPRRVAATSMAKRVGLELGLPDKVSYQIRFEGNRTEDTEILFMTDGVLMKEMETDIMLKKYSVIMIDEAHERSMYSDVLIGMLSRIAPLRAKTDFPLKLIIMSATLRLADFTHKKLFPVLTPQVIKVESRQFPVNVHFERRTPTDYMKMAFRKACRIHEQLPDGAILIFVSGQHEVTQLIKKLKQRYPIKYETTMAGQELMVGSRQWKKAKREESRDHQVKLDSFQHLDVSRPEDEEQKRFDGEDLLEAGIGADAFDDYEGMDEEDDEDMEMGPPPESAAALYCLPLYSLLTPAKQRRVFEPPPKGARMCVVATNVAETSITIPDVKYVVDTGYEKRRMYDPVTGVSQFVVAKCSQASADQRAGRAGRIAAGHAYRLYSSQVFCDMEPFSRPEIVDKPADQLVLHLKSMNIVKVVNFPFPSAPDEDALVAAERRLIKMGALAVTMKNGKNDARVTKLGKSLSVFPLAPAYAKVVAMANQHQLMPYAISLISALSVREPLISVASMRGSTEEETKQKMVQILKLRRSWIGQGPSRRLGDLMVLLMAVTESEKCNMNIAECDRLGLRYKAMVEVRKMRRQLTNVVNTSFGADAVMEPVLPPPTNLQCQLIRQMIVTGLPDRIAKRVDRMVTDEEIPRGAYQTQLIEEYVFIDPTSVMYTEEPEYVLFQEIAQVSGKKCMMCVMNVDEEWIPRLAESYCRFGDREKEAEIRFDNKKDSLVSPVPAFFGPCDWTMGMVDRPLPVNINTYKTFAQFWLAGQICPPLAEFTAKLLAPPTTMIRQWARLQPRTEQLLNALIEKEILSRGALLKVWDTEPNYLLEEYLLWVPEALHTRISVMWPPREWEVSSTSTTTANVKTKTK